jgi:hypothetical protein
MRRILFVFVIATIGSSPLYAAEYQAVNAGYRFLGIPDFALSPTFAAAQTVMAQGATMAYSRGSWKSHWQAGLVLGGMMIPDGYWQARDAATDTAVFVEYKLGFIGAFWAWSWRFPIWRKLFFSPTVGGGIAGVLGDVFATEVIPGCTTGVSKCGHWKSVTRHPIPISYRIMPLFIATGQFAWRFSPEFHVGLDFGLINLPFIGLSAEYSL